ncbi:MAG: radical SAM protein, partial [Oscillospiraceae bacterium]
FIHLLYVPTMNCNMSCKYCYLGDKTSDSNSKHGCVETLEYAVEKLLQAGIMPFNISLHGGEVTCLSKQDFRDTAAFISDYYSKNKALLEQNGFQVGRPHIKTNLFGLDRHIDAIRELNISVSGSLDLPFSLHDEFRVTKDGKSTLSKILENIELLRSIPNRKKVSATIFKEHFERLDELKSDIMFLHKNTCLDMNDFNFMVGFGVGDGLLTPLTEDEQVQFYEKMHSAFDGTELDRGVNGAWFAEFTPDYCTGCVNCGEKFFLLERNGDVYSCVRGQGNSDFFYGNIYENTVSEIMDTARTKIFLAHNQCGFSEDCAECSYLGLCRTGCPFVKKLYSTKKSYTCLLQKKIYERTPALYPKTENPRSEAYSYTLINHPQISQRYYKREFSLDPSMPTLEEIIAADERLKYIYSDDVFLFNIDGNEHRLCSQLLRMEREIVCVTPQSEVILYIRKEALNAQCDYPQNNSLYIMLLSGDTIVYGDEGREKQAHIMTHQVFRNTLAAYPSDKDGYYRLDMSVLLKLYSDSMTEDTPNNLFFTTCALRDYHYLKHKNNAFYHIQAQNLPFQNIELYYCR